MPPASLREQFEQYEKNRDESWRHEYEDYNDALSDIAAFQFGNPLAPKLVKEIWTGPWFCPNMISKPARLKEEHFKQIADMLTKITEEIIKDQSPEVAARAWETLERAKLEKKISWIPWALTKRLMYAAAPQFYTSIASLISYDSLVKKLKQEYDLNINITKTTAWLQNPPHIRRYLIWLANDRAMREALKTELAPQENDPFLLNKFIESLVPPPRKKSRPSKPQHYDPGPGEETNETEKFPFQNFQDFPEIQDIPGWVRNIILYGPPGTGKTYMARKLLDKYFAKSNKSITFHQSYSYEEFVEGIRPDLPAKEDGGKKQTGGKQGETKEAEKLCYILRDGIFKEICDDAKALKDSEYALLIDEINRGNISKIFGELITLIEESKREGKEEGKPVELPYSREEFIVPGNLYIIGTMNTADRSLAHIDTALRRRFIFVRMDPNYDLLKDNLKDKKVDGVNLRLLLETINGRIEFLYDQEHVIGHTFLLEVDDMKSLSFAFRKKILPLLEEYFFDDWKKISWVLGDNLKKDKNLHFLRQKENSGALFGTDQEDDGPERLAPRWEYNQETLNNPKAYIATYDPSSAGTDPTAPDTDTPTAATDSTDALEDKV